MSNIVAYKALKTMRVLIIGVGSMGYPLLTQFARHGVATKKPGVVILIDGDTVEASNLIYGYKESQLGLPKTQAVHENLLEINHEIRIDRTTENLKHEHIEPILPILESLDLLILAADAPELMLELSDMAYSLCPQVMAMFGRRCDFAEVAFSIPNQTASIRESIGTRTRTRIDSPQALGVDTAFVSLYVASLCFGIMLRNKKGAGLFPPIDYRAPLSLIGLRRTWIFEDMPQDQTRSVFRVKSHERSIS